MPDLTMLPLTKDAIPALYSAALAHQSAGRLTEAAKVYGQILMLVPDLPEAHFRLAQVHLQRGVASAAVAHVEAALARKPDEPALLQVAAQVHAAVGNSNKALAAHDALIAQDPKAVKPRADKALYLQTIGRFEDADILLKKLLKRLPQDGELHRMAAAGRKLAKGDALIRSMMQALAHPRQSEAGRMHLGYGLAKAMEDTGDTAKVFGYLNLANRTQRKLYPSQLATQEQERKAVLAAQANLPAPIAASGSPTPLFVTGMPRSGTTLVEQILASHSQVAAGGELGHARRMAFALLGNGPSLRTAADIPASQLEAFSRRYRETLVGVAPGVAFVTDKSIRSELVFGLASRAMPDARFIVVHRDPRDVALSIYKNYFEAGTHRYANDLAEIAQTIHAFRETVEVWRDRLPGLIHEVHYEDLVSDPDRETRALIAAAGLPWEDACLSFHEHAGTVRTLSLAQVRQPIHAGRKEAWRRYELELKPFTDAWEALTT